MATEVYTTEEITLLDGTDVELRPLPIAKLRKFMRVWSTHASEMAKKLAEQAESDNPNLNEADVTDAQFDTYIKLCAMGLEKDLKGDKSEKEFLAWLEDTLDEQTIYKILDVTGGLRLGTDPNLQNPASLMGAGTN